MSAPPHTHAEKGNPAFPPWQPTTSEQLKRREDEDVRNEEQRRRLPAKKGRRRLPQAQDRARTTTAKFTQIM